MKGIVTKQTDGNDGNRTISVFTPDYGIIKLNSRRKKNTTMSQFLCFGEFSVFGNSAIPLLSDSSPQDNFFPIHSDIKKLSLATYLSDTVYGFLGLNNPDENIYRLFINCIYALAYLDINHDIIKNVFEIRLVALAGYMPALSCCRECGDVDILFFDISKGEGFCSHCAPRGSFSLSKSTRNAITYICTCDIKKIFSFTISDIAIKELSQISEKYLIEKLGYTPDSLGYYKKIK